MAVDVDRGINDEEFCGLCCWSGIAPLLSTVSLMATAVALFISRGVAGDRYFIKNIDRNRQWHVSC